MNEKYIIATHGDLAIELKNSLYFLAGELPDIYTICAYTKDMDPEKSLSDFMSKCTEDDCIIAFTDLYTSSVSNAFFDYLKKPNVHVLTGVNLDLLCDMFVIYKDLQITERIRNSVDDAREKLGEIIGYD